VGGLSWSSCHGNVGTQYHIKEKLRTRKAKDFISVQKANELENSWQLLKVLKDVKHNFVEEKQM
jgi:hypothetical protein